MSDFQWTEKKSQVALCLAEGLTQIETGKRCDISTKTIQRWLANVEFSAEVDRLTLMTGIASRAERLRIAKQAVKQRAGDGLIFSKADLIDWLKYAQSETDGIKLDLAALFEAYASMAGGRPAGLDSAPDDE
jgi:transcriptional regulator with XRE-family HTH domain